VLTRHKIIQIPDDNFLDPVISVFIARQGKDYIEVYRCGRGSHVAPHDARLACLARDTNIDLDSLIATTQRSQAVLEDLSLSDLTNLPAPVQFCDTPNSVEIPLGESMVALLPQGFDEAFLQHLRSFTVTLNFQKLRAKFIGWMVTERAMMVRERAFTRHPHHLR
jgi:hypothetical protein